MSLGGYSLADLIEANSPLSCEWPGCEGPIHGGGYCHKHYERLRRGAELGCETKYEALLAAALALHDVSAEDDAAWKKAEARFRRAGAAHFGTVGDLSGRFIPAGTIKRLCVLLESVREEKALPLRKRVEAEFFLQRMTEGER